MMICKSFLALTTIVDTGWCKSNTKKDFL